MGNNREEKKPPAKREKYFTVPADIFLSKDGEWFHEGIQITHRKILEQLNRSLHREGEDYFVTIGWERSKVVIEDAPYLVRGVREEADHLVLELSDATDEKFDPETLTIGPHNVPYALVKKTKDRARFSRPAYYQLARHMVEGLGDIPALKVGNRLYKLKKGLRG